LEGNVLKPVVLIQLAALSIAPAVHAAGAPETGRTLALQWCTACHVVDFEGHGTDAAPALPALLNDDLRTSDEIRGWLAAPHPPMPDFDLTRQQIENIVAYLESLRPE
jgi:mono/diheme cytochrome c family protein